MVRSFPCGTIRNVNHLRYNTRRTLPGFTLIELLVVIAIIGILSTLAVVSFTTARRRARDAQRIANVKQIQNALEFYFGEMNQYPYGTINGQEQNGNLGVAERATLSADNGFAATAGGKVFMVKVPPPPTPPLTSEEPDNVYSYEATDSNYVISFFLEDRTGSLPPGVNCIDHNGMYAATGGVCPDP